MSLINTSYYTNNIFSPFHNLKLFGKITILTSILIFILLTFFSIQQSLIHYFILTLIALFLILLFINKPRIWIYVTTLSFAYFIVSPDVDVSIIDIISGIYYICGIIFWLVWQLLVNKNKLIRSIEDWLILFIISLLPLNLLIAYLNGIEIIEWARAASVFMLILYYFPIREYFSDKRNLTKLLVTLTIVAITVGTVQFYNYYVMISSPVLYAYELQKATKELQQIFTCSPIFFIVFALYQKKHINKIILFIIGSLTILGLLSTYSRAFWLVLILNLLITFFILPASKKKYFAMFFIIFFALFTTLTISLFKDNVKIYITILENRLLSSAKGTADISVQMRLKEYEIITRNLEEYILGGNGFGKSHKIYGSIYDYTLVTSNIHNGYLGMVYRIGLPMTIIYFLIYILFFIKSIKLHNRTKDFYFKGLLIGSFTSIIMLFVTSFVTAPFLSRDGLVILPFIFSFVAMSENNIVNKEENNYEIKIKS